MKERKAIDVLDRRGDSAAEIGGRLVAEGGVSPRRMGGLFGGASCRGRRERLPGERAFDFAALGGYVGQPPPALFDGAWSAERGRPAAPPADALKEKLR